ncbi:hypothetical protein WME91_03260 [Sorangium sp. So ce269]
MGGDYTPARLPSAASRERASPWLGEADGHRASPRPIELRPDDDPLYIGDGRRPNP